MQHNQFLDHYDIVLILLSGTKATMLTGTGDWLYNAFIEYIVNWNLDKLQNSNYHIQTDLYYCFQFATAWNVK